MGPINTKKICINSQKVFRLFVAFEIYVTKLGAPYYVLQISLNVLSLGQLLPCDYRYYHSQPFPRTITSRPMYIITELFS